MIFHIIGAALGALVHLLAICLKIVYNILKFLHVRLLVLYLAVCGLVQLIFHSFTGREIWFWIGLALCALVTFAAWTLPFRKRGKRRKREEREALEEERTGDAEEEVAAARDGRESPVYPRYYEAEGREGYVFAEYADRYELYRREGNYYILERTDEKPLERRR